MAFVSLAFQFDLRGNAGLMLPCEAVGFLFPATASEDVSPRLVSGALTGPPRSQRSPNIPSIVNKLLQFYISRVVIFASSGRPEFL